MTSCFSSSYAQARDKFVETCGAAGAKLDRYDNPARGPDGLDLSVDVARFGPVGAKQVVVLISGTHGVEGFCGSGCQLSWARSPRAEALPDDCAVVLIHFLNPYGGAWLRRETEDNVDLNRNFVDHRAPHRDNTGYSAIQSFLLLDKIDGPGRAAADKALENWREENGDHSFVRALADGQYNQPEGLYFGGHTATWSNQVLRDIAVAQVGNAERVAVIDIHSGLGKFGEGIIISLDRADSAAYARARQWFGDEIIAPFVDSGDEVPTISGHMLSAWDDLPKLVEVTCVILEFGTYSLEYDLRTHREENWLWRQQMSEDSKRHKIKSAFLEHAYPSSTEWRDKVLRRAQSVIDCAFEGIAAGASDR